MRVRLNLMPWREQRRAAAVRRFQASLLGSGVMALALVLLIDQLAQARLREALAAQAGHQAQTVALEAPLQRLDELVAVRTEVERRHTALLRLRAGQEAMSGVLSGLEQATPAGLQLTRLHLKNDQVTLVGLAATPALVARLVRDIRQLAVLRDVEVKHIRSTEEGDRFELVARLPARWS